jgi:hypothetical protein
VPLAKLGPPSLMSWREVDGGCEWAVFEPPQFKERVFLRSLQCPGTLVWYKAGGWSVFALESGVYVHDWKAAKVLSLPASPVTAAAGEFGFSNAGVLRACKSETRPVPEQENVGITYQLVWERAVDGSWNQVSEQVINYELTPIDTCSGAVDRQRTGTVYYNPQPQLANNCVEERQPGELCPADATIALFKSQVTDANDGFEYLAFSNSSFLAYPYVFGDSVHVSLPVFAIEGDRLTRIYERRTAPTRQWDISVGGSYFLVRDEIQLTHATLFEKGGVVPLIEFPDATRVIWIPGSVAAVPVIEMTR